MVYAQQSAGSSSLDEIGSLVRVRLDLVRAIFQNLGLSAGIDALEKYVADYSSSSPGVTIAPGANLTGFYLALGDVVRISAIVDA